VPLVLIYHLQFDKTTAPGFFSAKKLRSIVNVNLDADIFIQALLTIFPQKVETFVSSHFLQLIVVGLTSKEMFLKLHR